MAAAAGLQASVQQLLASEGKRAAAQALRVALAQLESDGPSDSADAAPSPSPSPSPASQAAGVSSGCLLADVTEAIGHTPLVRVDLARLGYGGRCAPGAAVLAKLEMQNPGGSVKDRVALQMIDAAERSGSITPGVTTLVEATSGNTGIALAMVAAARGYQLVVTMSRLHAMTERYILIRAFGAEVALAEPELKSQGFIDLAAKIARETPNSFLLSQFTNKENPRAHSLTTGPEIFEQTNGEIDVLVAGAGTGGTLVGAGRYLKEQKPSVRVVMVEPASSRVFQGAKHRVHSLVGIGTGLHVPMIEALAPGVPHVEGRGRGMIDEFVSAADGASLDMALRLGREQGLLVGPTSGAAILCACELACRPESAHQTIVAVCASSAVRYIQHPMFKALRDEANCALGSSDHGPQMATPSPPATAPSAAVAQPAQVKPVQHSPEPEQEAKAVAAEEPSQAPPKPTTAQVTRAEQLILELARRLLNLPTLKPTDTLVDFGATSLTAMMLLGQLRNLLEPEFLGLQLHGLKLAMVKEALWGDVRELTLQVLGLDSKCEPLARSPTLSRTLRITFCGG
jgi:cysteine synthase A